MTALRIHFSARWRDATSECPWALCDDSGAVVQAGEGPLASMPKARECIAVIAADRTLCGEIDAPSGARRRWVAALPFLAEEHTISDPEENQVVPGASAAGKRLALYVTDKAWLRQIADACRSANLPLRKALPEISLLPVPLDSWAVVWNGQEGFVCTAPSKGMAFDAGDAQSPPLVLQLLLETAPAPTCIELCFAADTPPERRIVPTWQGLSPTMSAGKDWDWRSAPIPAHAPNLLWGELAPPARPLEWWPRLRPAAMLVGAALAVEMIGTNLQWAMLSWEKRSLSRAMERSFHEAFGNAAVVVNAPLQMQRNLAELRHGAGAADEGDFLPLLDGASRLLANLPAGAVHAMHYESGRLDVEIRLNSLPEANALKNRVQASGANVRANIRDTGNGVNVTVTLQRGAAT